jgi:hypothetical protein
MLPFLVQTLNANAREAAPINKNNIQTPIENTISQTPDKNPDRFIDNDPASVKNILLKSEYLQSAKDFYAIMFEFLNGNVDDIELINNRRKALNKNVKIIHDITQNGMKTARFAVSSFFAKEGNDVVLKNILDITDNTITYENEAIIKKCEYKSEQALMFQTNDKECDYDIIFSADGEVVVVQKDNKNKPLKLDNDMEVVKFEKNLKVFPTAYITYRDQAWEEIKEKKNTENK